jgi:hypothetical protein
MPGILSTGPKRIQSGLLDRRRFLADLLPERDLNRFGK